MTQKILAIIVVIIFCNIVSYLSICFLSWDWVKINLQLIRIFIFFDFIVFFYYLLKEKK
jgi:hypothetical protein